MFCSISGAVPEQPVVSIKSGHLFEKQLIEKYVKETGKCPVSGESLALDDLLPLKASKTAKPRPSPATSVPGLLGLFHDEWDALMLETHTLRQSLHTVRQELSHALYMHDAATRVIARLIRERDDARGSLQKIRASLLKEQATTAAEATGPAAEASAPDEASKRQRKQAIPEEVVEELQAVNQQLSKGRKKRVISSSLATVEELAGATVQSSFPLHKTTQSGISAIDLNPASDSVLATAGLDGTIQILDYLQGRVLGSLQGHSKRLTGVAYAGGEVLLSSSADKTARIWRGEGGNYSCAAILKDHTAEVVGITVHPSLKYFVTGSAVS
jgi:pre-mRNA-processing factor 19